MNQQYSIRFITPCFCRGADNRDDAPPEIRPASIRGQLHWWFRAMGGSATEERVIFGSIGKESQNPSRVVVRVADLPEIGDCRMFATLPHKSGGHAAQKSAFAPGSGFTLRLFTRMGGLNAQQNLALQRSIDAWLHFGTLGLRATRAAGSFRWEGQPTGIQEWQSVIERLSASSLFSAALLPDKFESAEKARILISDTIGGPRPAPGAINLAQIRFPLGTIKPQRKTSPLRFRIVETDPNCYTIIAVWDKRQAITGNTLDDLRKVVGELKRQNKKIGDLLDASTLLAR